MILKNNTNDFVIETYPMSFLKEQSPEFLSYSILSDNSDVVMQDRYSSSSRFITCDIGCGTGLAPIITAATNPNIEAWGFDANTDAILQAQNIAQAADLSNVTLVKSSFNDFLKRDPPEFDLITIHGIFSWVGESERQEIYDILKSRLKPGGFVYISYNCVHGWASILPMRQLFNDIDHLSNKDKSRTINQTIDILSSLNASKASYFLNNKQNSVIFEEISKSDPNYLTHEYMSKDWDLFSLPELAMQLSEVGLIYAGTADLSTAFDPLHLNQDALQALSAIENDVLRSTARDFFMMPMLRKDIFANGIITNKEDIKSELLLNQNFCLIKPSMQIPHEFKFPLGSITLAHDVYNVITSILSVKASSAKSLAKTQNMDSGKILSALQLLVAAGFALPAVNESNTEMSKASSDRFNKEIRRLEQEKGIRVPYFASPVVGGAINRNTDITLFPALGINF